MTGSLRERLLEIGYTTDGVLERIGAAGQAGLSRNSTIPAETELGDDQGELATLIRLFLLQRKVSVAMASRALGNGLAELVAREVVAVVGDEVRALADLRPYGSDDGASGWLVSDLMPGLDHQMVAMRPDYVLGASPASVTLTQITMRTPIARALDLGTGSGVQSFHLAQHTERVVATDVNRRSLRFARFAAELSGIDVEFREGSIYEPVPERYDLIVSNPPYVMSPPEEERLAYRESVFSGDGLVEAVVTQAPEHLTPGGSLQLLTNWAIVRDQPWEERLTSWLPGSGCDLFALERERLDKFAYIEMWLTDAGLAGRPQWAPAYRQWLAYFDLLGIEEIGLGWLLLTNSGRENPDVRCESWPHAVAQPVGGVFSGHADAITASRLPEPDLLALAPRLSDVVTETRGQPGAADPEYLVLRQRSGLLRGLRLTTITGAVLGALDGELTVGQVVAAVAQLLDKPTSDVAAEALPAVRQALAEQYLHV